MGIALSQKIQQSQKVTLTPSLKKSIDLLQLSRYELINKIHQEIEDNPFIEKEEDYDITSSIDEEFSYEIESKKTLRDSLLDQINDLNIDSKSLKISKLIIDSIDEAGKLWEEIDELKDIASFECNVDEIESVLLNIIHKLSPYGIGYRNHKECIEIQLRNKNISTIESFESALKEIKKCDLSPGLNFEESKYIYPDLKIVVENNNSKIKFINNDFPKIKIDEDLTKNIKKDLKKNKNSEISEKISEARWLLSSVKKRNDTVLKVGEYIFSKQINFFKNNPIKIETLTNKEISEELGLHPSTVSRILKNKYIQTPKGIMPLKSLMVSSVSKSRNITSIQLMNLIKDIIKHENKPKSDKQITIELNKRGFNLARRTITKYRKRNNIPSSRDR